MSNDDSSPSIAVRLAALEARAEIEEVEARYARRSDAVFRDPGNDSAVKLAKLFTSDGILDLGQFGRYEGRDALINAFENLLPQGTKWSTHYIVNPIIKVDGDTATGRWYYLIPSLPAAPGASLMQFYGGYDVTYIRNNNGRWKIKEKLTSYFIPPSE